MRNFISLITLAALIIFMGSCKTNRINNSKGKYKGLDKTAVLKKYDATRLQFKTLQLKGKAEFTNPAKNQDIGFTYKITIAKDSLIVANVSKFGIPGAMVKIDQDSIRIRIPLEKKAIVCDFSYISSIIGFDADFGMVQNMLIGDASFLKTTELVAKSPTPFELQGSMSPYKVSWFLNGSTFKLEKMAVKDSNLGGESVVSYADFQRFSGQLVAMEMLLLATQPSPARIELKHSSVDFDKEKTNFSFRIPRSYEIQPCGKK
ncbi:MAG TPA: DUF4292 domain-containing protein [Bacteroidetes bacterium]|nr:DUF4292 domain-containing protein [Bacteroidota bacterium]